MSIKFLFFVLFLSFNIEAQDFDDKILKELESISKDQKKLRKCSTPNYSFEILGDSTGTINVKSKVNGLPETRKYYIYDESADFILAENMSMVNLDYMKGNLTPALVILKKPNKSLIIEGLSLKFQKDSLNENCLEGKNSITNLHCFSRVNRKANLRSFQNKVTLEYQGNLVRDIASETKKLEFPYAYKQFDSSSIRVGKNAERSIVLHNSQSVVNLTYTHKNTGGILANCNLTL